MDETQKNGIANLVTPVVPEQSFQNDSFNFPEQQELTTTDDSQFLIQPPVNKKIKVEPGVSQQDNNTRSNPTKILASVGIDLKESIYFNSVPTVITATQDRSSFVESVASLPGWKWKSVRHNSNGRETSIVHYLNSNLGIKFRTALAVIEYHRLEGREMKDLVEMCHGLRMGTQKMKKLFSEESWKRILESGVLDQQQTKPGDAESDKSIIGLDQEETEQKEKQAEEQSLKKGLGDSFDNDMVTQDSHQHQNDEHPMSFEKGSDKSVSDVLASVGIDMNRSKYFKATSKTVLSTVQARKEADFKETLTFLPDWKYRTVESLTNGKATTRKFFLVPKTNVAISTTLGVVECLRLSDQKPDDLVEACNSFRIGFRKFKKLFSDDEWKAIVDSGVLGRLKSRYGEGDTVDNNEVESNTSIQDGLVQENIADNSEPAKVNPVNNNDDTLGGTLAEILSNDGIHLQNSSYFSNHKESICLVQPRTVEFYTETLSFLPGWKCREYKIQVKGKENIVKRYLAPNNKVKITSSLGVVEFLRLQGRNIQELIVICNLFRIGSKKLMKLFSDNEWRTLNETGALSGLSNNKVNTKAVGAENVDTTTEDISGQDSSLEESKMELDQHPIDTLNGTLDSDYEEGKLQIVEPSEESFDESSFENSISALDQQLNEFHRELKNDTDQQTEKMMQELSRDLEEIDQDITTAEVSEKSFNENEFSSSDDKKERKAHGITSNNEVIVKMMAEQGIDIHKSNYFTTTKQAAFDGTKNANQFSEDLVLPSLPEGWKVRKIDVKQNGKIVIQKQYLSPNYLMFKAAIGVVELLRLEGKLNPTEILEVAKSLKVGDKKLKKLFNNEPVEGVEA